MPTKPGIVRVTDRAVGLLTLAAAVYMAARSLVRGTSFIFPNAGIASAAYLLSAGAVVAGLALLRRMHRRVWEWTFRVVIYGFAGAFMVLAGGRIRNGAADFVAWPPRSPDAPTPPFATLLPDERVGWGARVAAHYAVSAPAASGPIAIPADWTFPDDVEIALRVTPAGSLEVWARATGSLSACSIAIPSPPMSADAMYDAGDCAGTGPPPAGVSFSLPRRIAVAAPVGHAPAATGAWDQYRGDANKTGRAASEAVALHGWRATLDGEVRSSPAVVGDVVLVGAHGTGALGAFDLKTGRRMWQARAPNWIHQDPVSDGRVVVVGFGENSHRIPLHTPAGVAAYDVATGASVWTRFDESAVMTSPVVRGSWIVYISEGGIVRKRDIATGALIAEQRLPGAAIMGPPAATGDTLVAALENNVVCTLSMTSLKQLWCVRISGLGNMGHTAPAIADGRVIVSGHVPLSSGWRAQLKGVSLLRTAKMLLKMARGAETIGGQAFRALDLRDGHELWRSAIYPATKLPEGHISGTATVAGDVGVIVLPLADTLVTFDVTTGATRWTAGARGARGPPLIVDGQVILAGRDGTIEVRTLSTGGLTCSLRRAAGYDRAGPALAGNVLVFANLAGSVEAELKDDVVRCTLAGSQRTAAHP